MWLTRAGRRASTVFLFGWASTSGGPHRLKPSATVRRVGRCQELHGHVGTLVQGAVGRAKQRGGAGGLLSAPRLLQKVSGHQRHQLGSQSQDGQWEGAEPGADMWDLCTAWFVGRSAPGLWTMW